MIKLAIGLKLELNAWMPSGNAAEDIVDNMHLDTHDLAISLTKEDFDARFLTHLMIFCLYFN